MATRRNTQRSRLDSGDFDRVQSWAIANICKLAREAVPGWGKGPDGHLRGPCFFHGGSESNLAVSDMAGWYCHSACSDGGDGLDLWRRVHFLHLGSKEGRIAAIRDLAPRAGVTLGRGPSRQTFVPRPTGERTAASNIVTGPPSDVLAALDAIRAGGTIPATRDTILGAFHAALDFPTAGRDYLAARGFDPDEAHAAGFRWIDGPATWRELFTVGADFDPSELVNAGLAPTWPRVGSWTPPALVIPYWYQGKLIGMRFRNTSPDAEHRDRYRDNTSADWWRGTGRAWPRLPFNANALDDAAGQVVHVVEGELNAYALTLYGSRVIGLSGAGKWSAEWTPALQEVKNVVAWYDADAAGSSGRSKLADTLRDAFGVEWVNARGLVRPLPPETDLNDLHRAGTLARYLEAVPK